MRQRRKNGGPGINPSNVAKMNADREFTREIDSEDEIRKHNSVLWNSYSCSAKTMWTRNRRQKWTGELAQVVDLVDREVAQRDGYIYIYIYICACCGVITTQKIAQKKDPPKNDSFWHFAKHGLIKKKHLLHPPPFWPKMCVFF